MESNALRKIKMRHLQAYVAAVRRGSLKLAAQEVGLSQPAISKTLKELEDILGARLLTRGRGGVSQTPAGAVFLQSAEQSLAALSHGVAGLEALERGAAAPLRIGALPSVAADLLPDVIRRFASLSPRSPVTVEDGPIAALVAQLRRGALDLVIGRMGRPDLMRGLSFTQLYTEQVVFVVAKGHPLSGCSDLSQLSGWPVLYPPPQAAIRPLVDRFLVANGAGDWPDRVETVSGPFGQAMTLGPSQAVWIISHGVVARDVAVGRMTMLPIDTATMAGPVGIMARSEEDPPPSVRLMRTVLLEVVADQA